MSGQDSNRPKEIPELTDFSVGDRIVRPSLGLVDNGEEPVHVEPRSIDVLIALVERAGEVCPKKELIEAVWGAAFVSDEVLTHAIWDLRKAFGDDASHPRYIQTIPKRGYRLIAPVKPLEPAQGDWRARLPVLGLALAVLIPALLALTLFLGREDSEPQDRLPERHQLVLTHSAAEGTSAELEGAFSEALGRRLAGTQGLAVRIEPACPVTPASDGYCLQTTLAVANGDHLVNGQLLDSSTGEVAWKPAVSSFTDPADAIAAADELGELTAAYFEIIDMPLFLDPDLQPWFELARHDLRAIRDFLLGVEYSYRFETGARFALDHAAARDPDFIAPRVWRIPTLSQEGPRELLETYLADIDRLEADARPFEQAIILMTRAVVRGDTAGQIRHLDGALKVEPHNRQLQVTLGAILLVSGDVERAWRVLGPLARTRWRFRGLYASAGGAGILSGRLDEAEEILRLALPRDPVDPDVLGLLELLSIYRGDPGAAATFREQLERRIEQTHPEPFDFDRVRYADYLARRALDEGRPEIASELREFSG